jgi:PAS domain-containing protein
VAERQEKGAVVAEMSFIRRDGSTFVGEFASSAFGTDGEHTLFATTVRDVSEARRLTATLQERHPVAVTLRWILVSTELLQVDGSAERFGVVATFTDITDITNITERQQTMRALEALRSRLAFALDGAEDGVWDCDLLTEQVDRSARWAAMIGYAVGKLARALNTRIDVSHLDDRGHVQQAVDAHVAGEASHDESEFRMRQRDGCWSWILGRGKVVARDAEGRPLRATGTRVADGVRPHLHVLQDDPRRPGRLGAERGVHLDTPGARR